MNVFFIGLLFSSFALADNSATEKALLCLVDQSCALQQKSEEIVFGLNSDIKNYRSETGQNALQFVLAEVSDETLKLNFSVCEKLLERGVDINKPGSLGLTVLHDSVLFDQPKVVEFLLNKKADPSVRAGTGKFQGMTPLEFAQKLQKRTDTSNRQKIISLLKNK
jgi:ankyrin repeat protein